MSTKHFYDITKKNFDAATKKHLPNKWIKFAFKYFSKETEKKNMMLYNSVVLALFSFFLVGFLATIFKFPNSLIGTVTIIYLMFLGVLVLYLLSAVLMNNFRLRKIAKELNITLRQYNILVDKFS
jgi:hypothetical protein